MFEPYSHDNFNLDTYPEGYYDNNMRTVHRTERASDMPAQYKSLPEPLLRRQIQPIENFADGGPLRGEQTPLSLDMQCDTQTLILFMVFVVFLLLIMLTKQVANLQSQLQYMQFQLQSFRPLGST
jgi:hypothetical protein